MQFQSLEIIMTLLGGLGLLIFGMHSLTDSLQQLASSLISRVINSLTSNSYLALTLGVILTSLIQSSSVSSVMVIGFVNAKLMSLSQAICVLIGANVGTTITGWIASLYTVSIGNLFLAVAVLVLLLARMERQRTLARVLFSLGILFLGLELLSEAIIPLKDMEQFKLFMSYLKGESYLNYLLALFLGATLTIFCQSSSVMLIFTMALGNMGVLNFTTAIAMNLGHNIGTTSTALLASIGMSQQAKVAARFNTLFNVLGALIVFSMLPFWVDIIELIIPNQAIELDKNGHMPYFGQHLAASHTVFNLFCMFLFYPFRFHLLKIAAGELEHSNKEEFTPLVMVGDHSNIVAATAIAQANSELLKMRKIIEKLFSLTQRYLYESRQKDFDKIQYYEQVTDNIQKEVTLFVCKIMEKSLTHKQAFSCQSLIKVADEYESIADYLERIARYMHRLNKNQSQFRIPRDYFKYLEKIWSFFQLSSSVLEGSESVTIEDVRKRSNDLKLWADNIRDKHLEILAAKEVSPELSMVLSDMIIALRKIRAHSVNVVITTQTSNQYEDML